MVVAANVRAGRATALFAAFQPSMGTPVANFSAAGVVRLWQEKADIVVAPPKSAFDLMSEPMGPAEDEHFSLPYKPNGAVIVAATPTNVELLLKSNFGAKAGAIFTLATQVSTDRYLTLGWVENRAAGGPGYFCRIQDAWFHKLTLRYAGAVGKVLLVGEYAGRAVLDPEDLSAPPTVTLPASYAKDENTFALQDATLVLDPTGLNLPLSVAELVLTLNQGLYQKWSGCDGLYDVYKGGRCKASLTLKARVSDLTWQIINDARADTHRHFRLTLTAPSPAKTLQIDFNSSDFDIEPIGSEGQNYRDFKGSGDAHVVVATGKFVDISLS